MWDLVVFAALSQAFGGGLEGLWQILGRDGGLRTRGVDDVQEHGQELRHDHPPAIALMVKVGW